MMAACFIRKRLQEWTKAPKIRIIGALFVLFTMTHCNEDVSSEEILRRKALVKSYIEEKHEDWIETNDWYLNPSEMESRLKNTDETNYYKDFRPEDKFEILSEQENHEKSKYWAGNDHLKFSREEIKIDPEEREKRHKIVENFIPELRNLEKDDEVSSIDGSFKFSHGGSKNFKVKTENLVNSGFKNVDSLSSDFSKIKNEKFLPSASKTNNFHASVENNNFKRCSCSTVRKDKEGHYLTHWLNKLLRKISSLPSTSSKTISFHLPPDLYVEIEDISSGKLDLNSVDELITDLISNATISYGFDLGYFNFDGTLSFYIILTILTIVVLTVVTLFIILIFYYFRCFFCIVIFLLAFVWHYKAKYEEILAKKHAVVAGISPSSCESILSTESGIFAHIKEYFRYYRYNEDCEKYYKALLINPYAELPISTVFTDFLSATFFQFFIPMASALNTFVKNLFREMSLLHTIIFLIVYVVSMLIYNKYTLKLPFLMGSIEAPPPVTFLGSRVEDLQVKSSPVKENKSSVTISNKNGSSIIHQANNCSSLIILNDKDCLCKTTNYSFRRKSF